MAVTTPEFGALAAKAAARDSIAFRELVRLTTPVAYRVAYRIVGSEADAKDVLQETYIRVWQKLPKLRNPETVASWTYSICRNAALDRLRALARRPAEDVEDVVTIDGAASPETQLANAQSERLMQDALATLKERHRLVLLLRDVDGMSYEEISAGLGIPLGTVDSRLHRARSRLASAVRRAEQRQDFGLGKIGAVGEL